MCCVRHKTLCDYFGASMESRKSHGIKKRFFVFYDNVTQFVYCSSSEVSFSLNECFFDCNATEFGALL